MKRKYIWLIVSCLMVAILLLASCKAPAKKVAGGGIMTVARVSEVQTFEPLDAVTDTPAMIGCYSNSLLIGDWWVDRSIADFRGGLDCLQRDDVWVGDLAESWEQNDPYTVTFKLKKGIKWQDKPPVNGREFVASDVKQHFERLLAAPNLATHALQNIESITTPDNYTVIFKMKEVDVLMIRRIGIDFYAYINPPEIYEQYGDMRDWKNAVGTGPWILVDHVPGVSLTYEKNPNYFDKDPDGAQLPYIDGFKQLTILDVATQVTALRTGKIDISLEITWDQKPSLEKTNPDLVWANVPGGNVWCNWFKNNEPPFTDIRVRHALNMAVNLQEISDAFFGGTAITFNWPSMPEWGPGISRPLEELPPEIRQLYDFKPENVAKAKQLLADAGYPDGFNTVVQYEASGRYAMMDDIMVLIQKYWKDIGVNLALEPVDHATMLALRNNFQYKAILGCGGGHGEPMRLLDTKFRTDAIWNRGLISDPIIDDGLAEAVKEFDPVKRAKILKKVFDYLQTQTHCLAMPRIESFRAWQPWVKGYTGESVINYSGIGGRMARIWFDQDMRMEKVGR